MKNKKEHGSLEFVVLCLIVLILSSVCACLLVSCSNLFQSPPFVLSSPECVLNSETGCFSFAGVKFSVWNVRQSEIQGISVVFSIYKDKNGSFAFPGGNVVYANLVCSIAPGECETFEAGLDSYLLEVPESPYYVDFFYLDKVFYADGQIWQDPAGSFFVRGKSE